MAKAKDNQEIPEVRPAHSLQLSKTLLEGVQYSGGYSKVKCSSCGNETYVALPVLIVLGTGRTHTVEVDDDTGDREASMITDKATGQVVLMLCAQCVAETMEYLALDLRERRLANR